MRDNEGVQCVETNHPQLGSVGISAEIDLPPAEQLSRDAF